MASLVSTSTPDPNLDLDLLVTVPLSSIDSVIFPYIIEHLPEFRVLYYHRYKQVCFPSSLQSHLAEIHKVPATDRWPVIQFY